jgi:glycosyltransferase involved in cell wall biosynthesis
MPETKRQLRVVHLPAAVGGHAPMLAEAERRIGLDSRAIVLESPQAGYGVDRVLAPPGTGRLRREWRRWRLLAELLQNADVVHFNFGRPLSPLAYPRSVVGPRVGNRVWNAYAALLQFADVRLLRRRGKAVFVTYQGDDVRPGALADASLADLYDPELDRRKAEWAERFARDANRVYALNPDLLRVLPDTAEFLPYASVDLDAWRPVESHGNARPLVVHAPSDRRVKGTDALIAAVERVRARGVDVEFELVEGVSRDVARPVYERADIFVDQLLLGWYGGAAVELMALGKPVVAHVAADDLARVPAELRDGLPIVPAMVDTVEAVLLELLTIRRRELLPLGARGRAFVERWHDPVAIARRLEADYRDALGL